jgi:hypothetical protein
MLSHLLPQGAPAADGGRPASRREGCASYEASAGGSTLVVARN